VLSANDRGLCHRGSFQLFGLATPLFTQVIIDKVLMHKSLSTLHVQSAE
jgi:ABC-type bacteriocin/lantibiotic exporter with double-glycine peptidase domain